MCIRDRYQRRVREVLIQKWSKDEDVSTRMRKGSNGTIPRRVGGGYTIPPRLRAYRPPDLGLGFIPEDRESDDHHTLTLKDENLLRSAIAGDEIGLKTAIKQGADINCHDEVGHTPVIKSARHNNLKCLSILIAKKANLDLQDENGWTALFWASQTGSAACAKELIQPTNRKFKGCDFNLKSNAGLRALHVAINVELRSLIKNASKIRSEAKNQKLAATIDDVEDFSEFAPLDPDKKKLTSRTVRKNYTRGVRKARRVLVSAWGFHSESEPRSDGPTDNSGIKPRTRPQSAPATVSRDVNFRLTRKKEDFAAMSLISREMVSEPKTEPMVYSALWKYQARPQTVSYGNCCELLDLEM
eukprot:TRINITY_DN15767_c0_g1_i3.p1 TRINITY_DN15767_c0_g1~~TRINITY_DN15767_c0_g1_i3.p1  ORF type:complete len:357 (+),score=58.46 TRINITY_DN15767_c0_g1_i3:129-1199(+)